MVRRKRSRQNERGFALLLVFLMASVIAICLYMEVPRVAMESERAKEQLLIDRGEQYKRAIQLFTKKAGRYPARIEELESFQNQRFLRKRYIDPMTGKEEWRLVHIQNGILTDSKVSAPQKQGEEKKDNGSFAGIENSFGSGVTGTTQGGAALAQRRRPSESGTAGTGPELPPLPSSASAASASAASAQLATGTPPSAPAQPADGQPNPVQPNPAQPVQGQAVPGMPVATGQPGALPGQIPGQINGGLQNPQGQIAGGRLPGQLGNVPGINAPTGSANSSSFGGASNSFGAATTGNGMPAQPGQVVYNGGQPLPGQPGAPVNSQTGGVSPYSTTPGANGVAPGIPQPGAAPGGQNQNAADMINRILTSPRPGGMPTAATGGAALGGGIAGFASTAEGDAIMVYNTRTAYQEWEFIFDPQKQKQIPNPNATGAVGTPAQQLGTPAGGRGGVGTQGVGGVGGSGIGQGGSVGSTPSPSSGSSNSFGTSNSFNPVQTPTTPTAPKKQ